MFVSEQVEIEYVPEQPELEDGFSDEFKQIFEKFSFKELVASEVGLFSFGFLARQCLDF